VKGSKFVQTLGLNQVKYVTPFVAGTIVYQMIPQDRVVRASGATIAGTVRLPPVASCPLLSMYFIQAVSVATGTVTVAPYIGGQAVADAIIRECNDTGLGGGASASEVLSAAYGWVLLVAAGDCWLVIADDLDAA
jgi:hypothetical protein